MKLLSLLLALCLSFVNAKFETDKWDTQKRENNRFCGTTAYSISNSYITCKSYWLPPVRYDLAIIEASSACAVCSYLGAGCISCAANQARLWFKRTTAELGGALAKMPSEVMDLAGNWLQERWDRILDGAWYAMEVNGYKISARGAVFKHCGRECTIFGCAPKTCLQHQGLVQIKTERKGRYINLENKCSQTIKVAIHYISASTGQWTSKCWYNLSPGVETYTALAGGDRILTKNTVWYYYAETLDGGLVWKGTGTDDITRSCGGKSLQMRRTNFIDSDGDLSVSLTCNSRRRTSVSGLPLNNSSDVMEWTNNDEPVAPTHLRGLANNADFDTSENDMFWLAEYPQLKKHHLDHDLEPMCTSIDTGEDITCEKSSNTKSLVKYYDTGISIVDIEKIGDDDTTFEDGEDLN